MLNIYYILIVASASVVVVIFQKYIYIFDIFLFNFIKYIENKTCLQKKKKQLVEI